MAESQVGERLGVHCSSLAEPTLRPGDHPLCLSAQRLDRWGQPAVALSVSHLNVRGAWQAARESGSRGMRRQLFSLSLICGGGSNSLRLCNPPEEGKLRS